MKNKSMAKQTLGVRLDPKLIEILKAKVEDNPNLSTTEIVESALNDKFAGINLELYKAQIISLKEQLDFAEQQTAQAKQLYNELGKKIGKKISWYKTISMPVTREEHQMLKLKAVELHTSMGTLSRSYKFPSLSSVPMLTVK